MKRDIILEAEFFLSSFFWGIILLYLYDGIRIVRNIKYHIWLVVAFEDILFWGSAGIFVFRMIYERNDGIIRAYAAGAMLLGMWFYVTFISTWYVNFCVCLIRKSTQIMVKVIYQLTTPFRFMYDKIQKRLEKIGLFLQKRIKKVKDKQQKYLKILYNRYKIKSNQRKKDKLEAKKKRQAEKSNHTNSKQLRRRLRKERRGLLPEGEYEMAEKKQAKGTLERITIE